MDRSELAQLLAKKKLTDEDIVTLLALEEPSLCRMLKEAAFARTTELMGPYVYYRGLIELSNICTANCRYCGIRKDNHDVKRYTMTKQEIVGQAVWAAEHGYGSICLQSGERRDEKFVSFICDCLSEIHRRTVSPLLPKGVGITLSLGDQSEEVYRRWAQASGNPDALRYLARFETSNPQLFSFLHCSPGKNEKNLSHRLECLRSLRRAGYQVGTGVMIGIPGQSLKDLCRDIRLFQELDVDMIGMGPYLFSKGNDLEFLGQMDSKPLLQLSLNMIAVTRLVLGSINIAAATALQAIRDDGREIGIEYGCNVVMPNLSPQRFRHGYQLYDNKPCLDDDPTGCASCLEKRIASRGRLVGWNMTGSSPRYLRRVGLPNEVPPSAPLVMQSLCSGKRRIVIRAIAK